MGMAWLRIYKTAPTPSYTLHWQRPTSLHRDLSSSEPSLASYLKDPNMSDKEPQKNPMISCRWWQKTCNRQTDRQTDTLPNQYTVTLVAHARREDDNGNEVLHYDDPRVMLRPQRTPDCWYLLGIVTLLKDMS